MVIAAVSILATFLLVLDYDVTDVSFVVPFLVSLIGLGVAIDYSLLVVSRWREERAHGPTTPRAVVTAVRTAGHAVLASGVTVAISLVALLVVPVPFLRVDGRGRHAHPARERGGRADAAAGDPRRHRPARRLAADPRGERAARGWSAWARMIVRRRSVAAAVALVALGALVLPVFDLRIGQSDLASLSRSGPAYDAARGPARRRRRPRASSRRSRCSCPRTTPRPWRRLHAASTAVFAAVPSEPRGGFALVDVLPERRDRRQRRHGGGRRRSVPRSRTRSTARSASPAPVPRSRTTAARSTTTSRTCCCSSRVITFVLLVRTFRSVLLPLKAVRAEPDLAGGRLPRGRALLAAGPRLGRGVRRLADRCDHLLAAGADLRVPVRPVDGLRGLHPGPHARGVRRDRLDRARPSSPASGRTGRLVTSAALILFFAFAALASAPGTDIKVLGTALGVGILIDATLVRALLVPAAVSLFGRWNWWLPGWLARCCGSSRRR